MIVIPDLAMNLSALLVASIAAYFDLRTHKIPNKLTFPASLVGIIFQSLYFASWGNDQNRLIYLAAGALSGILGWFMGVFIMSFFKIFMRQFGHGDTKLMAAIGSFVGPWHVFIVFLYYSLCFGVFTWVRLAIAVPWKDLYMYTEMKKAGVDAVPVSLEKFAQLRKQIIPVAPFIALGALCTVFLERQTIDFLGFK